MNLIKEDCLTWAFRKGGKLYTDVGIQQLTLLEKPFQTKSPDFIFPGHKGSSWTVFVLPEIQVLLAGTTYYVAVL